MPIILQERKDKDIYLEPKNIKQLQQKLFKFDNVWKNNKGLRKDIPGVQQAKHVVNSDYNTNNDTKQEGQISQLEAERIIHHDKTDKNGKSVFHQLFDSDTMNDIKSKLNQVRTQQKPTLPQKDNNKKVTLPSVPSVKEVQPQKPTSVTESVDYSEVKFYEYLENYSVWEIFGMFENGENPFSPLINPSMYQKALSEFVKFGKFTNFPTKHIYQWMGIIMKNTAILRACTEICGHSNSVPVEEFIEFFFGGDEAMFEEYKESHNFDNDYDAMWEYLYEKGWDDYSKLPDGSDAISDYGIRPLEQIISEYNSDLEPEKVIVLINRLLDVVHCRGDIASMFIVGGSKTLSTISEEIKKKKTIFISEQQLNVLKEYRDQLQLPFQNSNITTNKYARPNYQHYIDWLESIGKYGKLPKSECDINYHYYKHFENAMIDWWDHECESYTPEELKDYYYSEWMEQHADELNNLFKLPPHEIQDYINNGYEDDLIEHWLNNYGSELWNNYLTERFEDKLDVYDFANNLTINDRGLIYIERMITIPNALEYNFSTYYKQYQDDLYQHLSKTYNGVGICWSWKENGANAYNGSEYTSSNETRIVLKGWIKCEDIDWEQTLVCNAWGLNDEKEIQTVTHKQVEIFEIMDVSHDVKIPLKKPIIVLT